MLELPKLASQPVRAVLQQMEISLKSASNAIRLAKHALTPVGPSVSRVLTIASTSIQNWRLASHHVRQVFLNPKGLLAIHAKLRARNAQGLQLLALIVLRTASCPSCMIRTAWALAHQALQVLSKHACHAKLHARLASILHHNASHAILRLPSSTYSPFRVWTIVRSTLWLTHRNSYARDV